MTHPPPVAHPTGPTPQRSNHWDRHSPGGPDELDWDAVSARIGGGATPAASAVTFTPTGTIGSTNVQAAIAEVASEAGGAAATSLPSPVFNAKTSYGAVGNDVADDGPAIRSAIAAGAGHDIYLPAGTYRISTSDGLSPTHALLLNTIGTRLVGDGSSPDTPLTTINITVSGLIWGVAVTAGHCEIRNIRIRFTGTTAPYWLYGCPGIPGSSVHNGYFEDVHGEIMAGADIPVPPTTTNDATHSDVGAAICAFGPEYPTTTNFDCAGFTISRCSSLSYAGSTELVSGFLWGNGTVGNVLANQMNDCQAIACTNGLTIAGGGVVWTGGQFSQNTSKDVWLQKSPNQSITFSGVRGEVGKQVLSATDTSGAFLTRVSFIACYFGSYSPTSPTTGEMMTLERGCLTLIDCRLGCLTSGQAKVVINTAGTTAPDANYFYAQLIAIRTDVNNTTGTQWPTPLWRARSVLVVGTSEDGYPTRTYLQTDGLKIPEYTNAKQGVSTLVGGTVVVSNASVTANSRIFLCCNTPGGTPGFLRVSRRTAGTSFTILSSSGSDTSTVAWEIFEPA